MATMDDRHEGYNSASLDSFQSFSEQNSAVEDYDYDSPYWAPAGKKVELLSQFRKLKIRKILPENIKLVNAQFTIHVAKIIAPLLTRLIYSETCIKRPRLGQKKVVFE